METMCRDISLGEFFSALEKRLDHSFPGEWVSFRITVCGKIIELRFSAEETAQNAMRGLFGCIEKTHKTPDAVFKYWEDDFAQYIGEKQALARWHINDADGYLSCWTESVLMGVDARNNIFYYCHHIGDESEPTKYAHLFHQLFYLWGRTHELLMLHGAAVGDEGRGVLIVGRGGAGKSTLSTACLLSRMEFVGDDYIFISEKGRLQASPVYSSVCLNPDMYHLLNSDMPILWKRENGKLELDTAGYTIAQQLPVNGLIVPAVTGGDKPEIVPVSVGTAITRVAHSTAAQMMSVPSPELVRTIAARLMGLPAFEFRQCQDVKENVEFLRQFIRKEL